MPRRLLKQILYGALFLSFWIAVIYGAWTVFYQPTCFDRIKNQGEEGVDCGGPCQSCEIKTLGQPIVLRTLWLKDAKTGKVDFAAEIKNPNASWGVKVFDYLFSAFDSAGKPLMRLDGKSFILPGGTRWIIVPALSVIGEVSDVKFEIAKESIVWQKLKPFSQDVRLVTRSVNYRRIIPPEIGFAEVSGEVVNLSSFTLEGAEMNAILFDNRGSIVALGRTIAKTLKPGENRFFLIKWPSRFDREVTRWEVEAESNFLLDQNFIQRYGD